MHASSHTSARSQDTFWLHQTARNGRHRPISVHEEDPISAGWGWKFGLAGVPMILETPGMDAGWDAVNMARVRHLLAGEVLEPLPPGAYLARGARD